MDNVIPRNRLQLTFPSPPIHCRGGLVCVTEFVIVYRSENLLLAFNVHSHGVESLPFHRNKCLLLHVCHLLNKQVGITEKRKKKALYYCNVQNPPL